MTLLGQSEDPPDGVFTRVFMESHDGEIRTDVTITWDAMLGLLTSWREAVEAIYEALTDADTLGPDVTETAVEAARMIAADKLVSKEKSRHA
jgi:hypothetical protein